MTTTHRTTIHRLDGRGNEENEGSEGSIAIQFGLYIVFTIFSIINADLQRINIQFVCVKLL